MKLPPKKNRRSGEETSTKRGLLDRLKISTVKEDKADEEDIAERVSHRRTIDVSGLNSQVQRLLKFSTFEPEQRYWLDTGSPDLNQTLGSRELGLPYGKIYEIFGDNHGGKTAICTILAGIAQEDGAAVGYIDLEDSRDETWASRLGMDFEQTVKVYPKLVHPGKASDDDDEKPSKKKKKKSSRLPRLQSAEEMFAEAEASMAALAQQGFEKQFWFLDSIANLQTAMVIEAGALDQNMRTNGDRALFLSRALPRWAGLAANYNASIFLINQIRTKPGVAFGNPEYTPGGKAVGFAASIRARVRRLKGGQLRKGERVVGIVGTITNEKNKAGKGSIQSLACGFKIKWNCMPAKVEFMSKAEAEELLKA